MRPCNNSDAWKKFARYALLGAFLRILEPGSVSSAIHGPTRAVGDRRSVFNALHIHDQDTLVLLRGATAFASQGTMELLAVRALHAQMVRCALEAKCHTFPLLLQAFRDR